MCIKSGSQTIAAFLVILVAGSLFTQTDAAEPYGSPAQLRQTAILSAGPENQICPSWQQQGQYATCPNCRYVGGSWMSYDKRWLDGLNGARLGQKLQAAYCRKKRGRQRFYEYLKKRFGYFNPTGCCRGGCPPVGSYKIIYATNPGHFDPRDGRIYAAPSTGIPVAVPIAPNVRYTWNYGQGMPSSRLTQLSTFVPAQRPQNLQ